MAVPKKRTSKSKIQIRRRSQCIRPKAVFKRKRLKPILSRGQRSSSFLSPSQRGFYPPPPLRGRPKGAKGMKPWTFSFKGILQFQREPKTVK